MTWLPYMWSKGKISKQITDFILKENPNTKYIYDLFGGGWAISFEFLERWKEVVYNEIDTGVTELLKKLQKDWVTEEMYKWYSMEEFFEKKDLPTWEGWLLKTCWTFWNNWKNYLYWKDKEENKKILHDFIVYLDLEAKQKIEEFIWQKVNNEVFNIKSINERRLFLMRDIKKIIWRFWLQNVERLQNLENLERLQNLENLARLEIQNKSYDEVIINTPIDETVIYLDPPYKWTSEYNHILDYDKLDEFIKNSKYKIYLSSYEYEGLNEVFSIEKQSMLSGAKTQKKILEKLFCNK